MSLLENTHLTFEIQKSRFVEIKNRLKSVEMENSNDSDGTSELQIDDTNQDIIENPETQSMVSEDFMAKNPTILSLLQQATREESTQHAQSTSPVGTATLSIASDDDSKSAVMDLSTRKDDISGPPSTSSGADQNGNGGSISRSAGRKKTHPVWQFFKDLRDSDGVGSVICLHCDWKTDDRSPNNLRTHLKRSHDNEIYSQYLLAQAQTPTQPYVKRNRGMGSFLNSMAHLNGQNAASFNYGMQSLQDTIKQELIDLPNTLDPNVLNQQQLGQIFAEIVRNTEVMSPEDVRLNYESRKEFKNMNNESLALYNSMLDNVINNTLPKEKQLLVAAGPSENHETALIIEANPINNLADMASSQQLTWTIVSGDNSMLNNSNGSNSGHSEADDSKIDFSLSDPITLAAMLQVALDLDLTFACHGRRGQLEFCFESNRTAERSGGRGRMITLINNGKDIVVSEKVNGQIAEYETWKKTDLMQLMWAIRGKCQKALSR